jgi:hypothetical protein
MRLQPVWVAVTKSQTFHIRRKTGQGKVYHAVTPDGRPLCNPLPTNRWTGKHGEAVNCKRCRTRLFHLGREDLNGTRSNSQPNILCD